MSNKINPTRALEAISYYIVLMRQIHQTQNTMQNQASCGKSWHVSRMAQGVNKLKLTLGRLVLHDPAPLNDDVQQDIHAEPAETSMCIQSAGVSFQVVQNT